MRGLRFAFAAVSVGLLVGLACSTQASTDAKLNEKVEARLAQEPKTAPVTVSTQDRIVRLNGVVDSTAERNRLELAVRHVDGVLAVDNELVTKPPVETTGATVDGGRGGYEIFEMIEKESTQPSPYEPRIAPKNQP